MAESISGLARDLIGAWAADGTAPEDAIEACGPRLAAALDIPADAFDCDRFRHRAQEPGWTVERIEFPDYFDGYFPFYRPVEWSTIARRDSQAQISDATAIRQSIFLVTRASWRDTLERFFEASDVEGLCFRPRHRGYASWVMVTGGEGGPWWLWAVHAAGDWLIVAKGDAGTAALLEQQLIAMTSSSPWAGWIQRAQRADPAP